MKHVFFVIPDKGRYDRQSDGVELCYIPEFFDERVYFYCKEYDVYWDDLANVGDLSLARSYKVKSGIKALTLSEVCDAGLAHAVQTIKEYNVQGGSVKVNYIHLNN